MAAKYKFIGTIPSPYEESPLWGIVYIPHRDAYWAGMVTGDPNDMSEHWSEPNESLASFCYMLFAPKPAVPINPIPYKDVLRDLLANTPNKLQKKVVSSVNKTIWDTPDLEWDMLEFKKRLEEAIDAEDIEAEGDSYQKHLSRTKGKPEKPPYTYGVQGYTLPNIDIPKI